MAVSQAPSEMSSSRRFGIGANVVVAIVAAAALVAAVNYFGSLKKVTIRKDIAASGYGLSDRTKQLLTEGDSKISISMLYQPDETDEKQRGYIDRLTEYLDEMKESAPDRVSWAHIVSDNKKEELVATLNQSLGGEAGEHKKVLDEYNKFQQDLQAELKQRVTQASDLRSDPNSWLGDFPVFGNIAVVLHQDELALEKTATEIAALIPANGIPKYGDAATKASAQLTEIKTHLTTIRDNLSKLTALADQVAKPDSPYAAVFRDLAAQVPQFAAGLREAVGGQNAPPPADIAGALRNYADQCNELTARISPLVKQIDQFEKQFPAVQQHNSWTATASSGIFQQRLSVADILQQFAATAKETRLRVLGALDSNKPDEQKAALDGVRRTVSVFEQNMSACNQLLTSLADRLMKVDPKSKGLLDEARDNGLFKDRIAAATELEEKIKKLPELKLSNVGDRIKEPNSVLIEVNNKVRVLAFNDVFPIRDTLGAGDDDEQRRTFNGDSAISSALIALTHERPFASVVLTYFEPPAPQQRGPFSPPPPEPRIPRQQLNVVKQRLESANFKVNDWNLATTDESPKPEEGTENVYIVFPPAPPTPPNPFGGPPPDEKKFGDEQINKIRNILANNGRVLFVATWDLQRTGGMFGGGGFAPVPYAYEKLLSDDWGLEVDSGRRICYLLPDSKAPDTYGVSELRFNYMPVSGFSDSDLARPLRGTRFLVNDACPIVQKPTTPQGVTLSKVLSIPESETHFAPDIPLLLHIVRTVLDPESEGLVQLPGVKRGPFDLMITGERKEGDKDTGRIALMSFGMSLSDAFLDRPIKADKSSRFKFLPPPRESLDLVVNSVYWLQGQPKRISRGPIMNPTVEPIDKATKPLLSWLVYGIWPVLIFLPGIFLWYVRRK